MYIKNLFIKIYKIIKTIIKFFKKLFNKIFNRNNYVQEKLLTLTPKILDDENAKYYIEKIDQLLEINDCKNISLIGGYGSGKSSIIKTFLAKRPEIALNSMIITIGSYINEVNDELKEKQGNDGNLSTIEKSIANKVEVSILKQMIYRNNDLKFPKSTLIRLNIVKKRKIFIYMFIILFSLIFFISNYYRYFKNNDINVLEITKKFNIMDFSKIFDIYNLFGIIMIIIIIIIMYKLLYYLFNKMKISKIKIGDSEFDFQNNGSIFSKYLSEIVYFFQVTKTNLVIFEDLDRFQSDVSLKVIEELKELNQILNTSYGMKKIVFMYLLKDDLFRNNEEKNKFYDYNLSILPISNYFNSKLNINSLLTIEKINSEISPQLIEIVSKYIYDMRSIINIVNDYILFKHITSTQNYDKLFAMIVFKNYYFKEYNLLYSNQNVIEEEFHTVENKRKKLMEDIDANITIIKSNIKKIKSEVFDKKKDLKHLLLSVCQREIDKTYPNDKIHIIRIDDYGDYDINQFLDTDIDVDVIEKSNIQMNTNYGRNIKEDMIFPYFDSKEKFVERYRQIDNSNMIENLENELSKLNDKKEIINNSDVNTIFRKYISKEYNDVDRKLLCELIANNYISEDYLDYITAPVIYKTDNKSESLTASDNIFLMNIRQEKNSYDIKLSGFNIILNEITNNLTSPYVLNYDLLKFLIENNKEDVLSKLFMQFNNFDKDNIKFLINYLRINDDHTNKILGLLYSKKYDIWHGYMENHDSLSKSDGLFLVKIMILSSNYVDIIKDKDFLKEYIEKNIYEFEDDINNYLPLDVVKKNFLTIKPRIDNVTIISESNFDFIYKYKLYSFSDINMHTICNGILMNVSNLKRRKNMNFLYEYIKDDLKNFCNEYYINHNTIFNERTISMNVLLDETIGGEVKKILLKKEKFIITKFDNIDSKYFSDLVVYRHIKPNWKNILFLFDKIDVNILLDYFMDNVNNLLSQDISSNYDIDILNKFFKELIRYTMRKKLNITEKIIQFHHVVFSDVKDINVRDLSLLIKNRCVEYNKINYKYISDVMDYNNKMIYIMDMFENYRTKLSKFINIVNIEDIEKMLHDENVEINDKVLIIYSLYKKEYKIDIASSNEKLVSRFKLIFTKNKWYHINYNSTLYNKLIKNLIDLNCIKEIEKNKQSISFIL